MLIEVTIIGVLSAFLTLFINYCIGKPGSEKFSPYEIFSFYTVWLSKMRLKKMEMWEDYVELYKQNMGTGKVHSRVSFRNDFKKIIYEAAEPYFTWERAAGMCPVCNGVWVAGITSIILRIDVINILIVILISHIVIRLLTKII